MLLLEKLATVFNVMLLFHSVWQSYTIFVNSILQIVDKDSYTGPLPALRKHTPDQKGKFLHLLALFRDVTSYRMVRTAQAKLQEAARGEWQIPEERMLVHKVAHSCRFFFVMCLGIVLHTVFDLFNAPALQTPPQKINILP